MTSKPDTPPRLAWLALAGLAVGLGAGPLLAALLPLAPWTAAAVLFGAGPLAWWTLAGESRVARLDVEQGRSPFRRLQGGRLAGMALLATLAAAVATVHAAWGAVALAQLADDGPHSVSEKGITTWMGSEQGYLGQPGLQGSTALLLAVAGVLLVVALVDARRWRGWALVLLGVTLAIQSACSVVLWIERGVPAVAAVDLHEAWPGWRGALGDMGLGLFAGLLLTGAGFGVLHALQRAESVATAPRRLLRLIAPAAATVGLLASWPAAVALPGAPLGAPAPYGRLAAIALLAPASSLDSMAWQAAWFAGVLAAGLLGAVVAGQVALRVLEGTLGVKPAPAAAVFAVLVGLVCVTAVLLPGVLETLFAFLGALLTLLAATWITADWPASVPRRLVAILVCLPCALGLRVLNLLDPLHGTWQDEALVENGVLAGLLVALLFLWWLALAGVAALRARRDRARELRPPGPVAPAPRHTRA